MQKRIRGVNLFDISRTYRDIENAIEQDKLPQEDNMLTLASYGKNMDFYNLKGIVENVFETSNVKRYEISSVDNLDSYHPGRTAKITIGNDTVAVLGQIHPIVAQNYGVLEEVYIAEINIDKLTKYSKEDVKYKETSKFPAVVRDIAVVVDEQIEVGKIENVITKKCKKILEDINLFDVYRSEKLGENKKSIAYSLTFRSNEKTLTDEEINVAMNNIIEDLQKELNAELRK